MLTDGAPTQHVSPTPLTTVLLFLNYGSCRMRNLCASLAESYRRLSDAQHATASRKPLTSSRLNSRCFTGMNRFLDSAESWTQFEVSFIRIGGALIPAFNRSCTAHGPYTKSSETSEPDSKKARADGGSAVRAISLIAGHLSGQ